jgi:acetate kinase
MGLTPMEGLIMGTRSGDVDPGLLLHLIRTMHRSPDEVNDLLNHRSGLLGLSDHSADVRELENRARSGDANAERALESFAYRARKYIGAYTAVLGGAVDAIAFTGGIGEHSADMRARICRGLTHLGITLDVAANERASGDAAARIDDAAHHALQHATQVWVIPTDEELQIAREVQALLDTAQ